MNELGRNLIGYAFDRLDEPSTYRGLTLLLTAIMILINPESTGPIAASGLGISGGLGMLLKDKLK